MHRLVAHATVVIDGCDSGVPNTTFATGCRISDQINDCAVGAGNHGGFVSCVAHLTDDLKKNGTISGSQKGAIQSCAAARSPNRLSVPVPGPALSAPALFIFVSPR